MRIIFCPKSSMGSDCQRRLKRWEQAFAVWWLWLSQPFSSFQEDAISFSASIRSSHQLTPRIAHRCPSCRCKQWWPSVGSGRFKEEREERAEHLKAKQGSFQNGKEEVLLITVCEYTAFTQSMIFLVLAGYTCFFKAWCLILYFIPLLWFKLLRVFPLAVVIE